MDLVDQDPTGINTHYRVTPTRKGDYDVVCAELCGLGHATMRQTAHVMSGQQFTAWLNKQRKPILYQQSTYAPGGSYRWLGSMAMDRKGNIGMGYSFGGDPNYAGQRFAARLAKDPKGQLTFHEGVLAEGHASQTGSLRWEDYTNIVVDPSDNCTFWFIGNYLKSGAPSSTTRIGSFAVPLALIAKFP